MTAQEWVADKLEDLRVRWLMLDAQAKQMVILAAGYAIMYALDVCSHVLKQRLTKGSA